MIFSLPDFLLPPDFGEGGVGSYWCRLMDGGRVSVQERTPPCPPRGREGNYTLLRYAFFTRL